MKEAKAMEEQTKYFYQPDPTSFIIDWSWTLIIIALGVIIWLEYTYFQWISGVLIAAGVILAIAQFARRTVVVTPTKMTFNRLLQKNFVSVPLSQMRQPIFTKHTMSITVSGEVMTFTFSQRTIKGLKALLGEEHNQAND